jgi:hypothetical protein
LIVALALVSPTIGQDPTCAAFIQQMNNDSCCPLVLEEIAGGGVNLNKVDDAIPVGVDNNGDTIYLGAACANDGVIFAPANVFQYRSSSHNPNFYYIVDGSTVATAADHYYIVRNPHKCVMSWLPIKGGTYYYGYELNYQYQWLPQFFNAEFKKTYVAQATFAPVGGEYPAQTLPLVKHSVSDGNVFYYIFQGGLYSDIDFNSNHNILTVDCYNSTQRLLNGATVVNFTTDYNPVQTQKYVVKSSIGSSVALINNSPVSIFESVTKSYTYISHVEQSVDKSSYLFQQFDVGGSYTVGGGIDIGIFNMMASISINADYTRAWNTSESTHNAQSFTNEQSMNSTKQVTVPPYTSTIIDFMTKTMKHPSVNYVTFVKISHATLNKTQIYQMLEGQGIAETCVIEADDVLCKLTGSIAIDTSLGLDFEATGSHLNQTVTVKDEL